MKTILRTLFYQFFLLFVGGAVGFILNAEYIGWKSIIIERSIQNIFFPIPYSPEVEQLLRRIGFQRLCTHINGDPRDATGITIIDELIWNEEVYIALYEHTDTQGKTTKHEYSTRLRWKSWEYYYEYHPALGAVNEADAPVAPQPPQPVQKPAAQFSQPVPGPVFLPSESKDDRRPWCR